MATIIKREGPQGVSYLVRIRVKGQPAIARTFPTKKDAERYAREAETEIRSGRYLNRAEAEKHTFGELVDRYIEKVIPGKSAIQQAKQTAQLNWWKSRLANKTLAVINQRDITTLKDELLSETTYRGSKRSPATVNRYQAALSHLFNTAKKWGWCDLNPCEFVGKESESKGRTRFLDKYESKALIEACRESKSAFLYPIVLVAMATGMRQSEVLWLHWKEPKEPPKNTAWGVVHLEHNRIILHNTKNGDSRAVPLTSTLKSILKDLGKVRRIDSDLLFPSRESPQQPASIRTAFESAVKQAGIQDFRFHDLRHTAASHLLMSGASLGELAAVLGHKTLAMVKRYSHLSETHTASILERMNSHLLD